MTTQNTVGTFTATSPFSLIQLATVPIYVAFRNNRLEYKLPNNAPLESLSSELRARVYDGLVKLQLDLRRRMNLTIKAGEEGRKKRELDAAMDVRSVKPRMDEHPFKPDEELKTIKEEAAVRHAEHTNSINSIKKQDTEKTIMQPNNTPKINNFVTFNGKEGNFQLPANGKNFMVPSPLSINGKSEVQKIHRRLAQKVPSTMKPQESLSPGLDALSPAMALSKSIAHANATRVIDKTMISPVTPNGTISYVQGVPVSYNNMSSYVIPRGSGAVGNRIVQPLPDKKQNGEFYENTLHLARKRTQNCITNDIAKIGQFTNTARTLIPRRIPPWRTAKEAIDNLLGWHLWQYPNCDMQKNFEPSSTCIYFI